jgi:glycosyltransferase involved in cell wall biosynthesis
LPEPLRGKVSVYPAGADVRPYYAAADVFVLCSLIESYPRVILEAMTYGLPVITTPVFGVLEQVSENENALFFEPGNVAQLARNMDCLLHNKSLCMQMAGSSLKKARELTTFDEMVRSYEKIFQDASFNG